MKPRWLWLVAVVGLGLAAVVSQAVEDAPAGVWVTLLIALVLLACGAVVVACLRPTPDPMTRIRRVTFAWLALTMLSSPFAYGAPLFVTVPGLAALLARLYVGPSGVPGRKVACLILGSSIVIGLLWFSLRVDEVPIEGVPAAAFVVIGVVGLTQLRRQSRKPVLARS